jgi:hypothetical protein
MLHKIERLLVAKIQALRSMGSCALNMCYGMVQVVYDGYHTPRAHSQL